MNIKSTSNLARWLNGFFSEKTSRAEPSGKNDKFFSTRDLEFMIFIGSTGLLIGQLLSSVSMKL